MKIYELLGLEPYEQFKIKNSDSIFCFNPDDDLCYITSKFTKMLGGHIEKTTVHVCGNKLKVLDLIHNPDLINKIDDEKETKKESKKEIILNLHDSIILSGIETQYNSDVKSVKKIKNWPGFTMKLKDNENWEDYFEINFLELDFLEDNIRYCDMIEFEIGKNEKGYYVAKQI